MSTKIELRDGGLVVCNGMEFTDLSGLRWLKDEDEAAYHRCEDHIDRARMPEAMRKRRAAWNALPEVRATWENAKDWRKVRLEEGLELARAKIGKANTKGNVTWRDVPTRRLVLDVNHVQMKKLDRVHKWIVRFPVERMHAYHWGKCPMWETMADEVAWDVGKKWPGAVEAVGGGEYYRWAVGEVLREMRARHVPYGRQMAYGRKAGLPVRGNMIRCTERTVHFGGFCIGELKGEEWGATVERVKLYPNVDTVVVEMWDDGMVKEWRKPVKRGAGTVRYRGAIGKVLKNLKYAGHTEVMKGILANLPPDTEKTVCMAFGGREKLVKLIGDWSEGYDLDAVCKDL